VTQDDKQPEHAQGGRISRDTLLLLGALTFLILAVALTFLFTPGSTPIDDVAASQTAVAAATASVEATTGTYPAPATDQPVAGGDPDPSAYPSPEGDTPLSTSPTPPGGYPNPEANPSPETNPSSSLIPTGDPASEASPTRSTAISQQTSVGPSPTTQGGYPIGEGTPPTAPTFGLTVVVPTATPAPPAFTAAPVPTTPPPPTAAVPPTVAPPPVEPTSPPVATEVPPPTLTEGPPPPPPADVLRGNVRWAAGQSPVTLTRDVQIAPGAELIIEPGVEVRLAPGVSIFVDGGRLLAMGLPGQPVRFVGTTSARWSGIFGRPSSFIVLENTEVRGGGAGGTIMAVDRSELIVRNSRFQDNGGAILLTDTRLELRDSEVSGNDMPFGPALEAIYGRGTFVTMVGNRFGGNRLSEGAPQVRISNTSTFETLNLDIQANLIRGGSPNLQLATNGPLKGVVLCNSLIGDAQGFGLRTQTPQVRPNGTYALDLKVEQNYMDEHIPPIIPVYLRFGLGRGATSEVSVDMRNNWWGESTGPYEPDTNPLGRGDSVGSNISYAPWLKEPPPCAAPR
jgi:hypothetical protein